MAGVAIGVGVMLLANLMKERAAKASSAHTAATQRGQGHTRWLVPTYPPSVPQRSTTNTTTAICHPAGLHGTLPCSATNMVAAAGSSGRETTTVKWDDNRKVFQSLGKEGERPCVLDGLVCPSAVR